MNTVYEISFDHVPSNEELRRTVQAAGLSAYRFVGESPDHMIYQVEPVDLEASLQKTSIPATSDTWTVPVTITCQNCKRQFKGWEVVLKKWYDNKPYHFSTFYCPECPPLEVETWLADRGIMLEKPVTVREREPKPPAQRLTLEDLGDF